MIGGLFLWIFWWIFVGWMDESFQPLFTSSGPPGPRDETHDVFSLLLTIKETTKIVQKKLEVFFPSPPSKKTERYSLEN